MKIGRLFWCLLVFLIASGLAADRYRRDEVAARQDFTKSYKAAEGLPDIVVIYKTIPDTGQVCAEPKGGGILSCRSVGEFRKWAMEPSAPKRK